MKIGGLKLHFVEGKGFPKPTAFVMPDHEPPSRQTTARRVGKKCEYSVAELKAG